MSARLNKRLKTINSLFELKCEENIERERLIRNKISLEKSITENFIITGSLQEIQEQVKVLKREKREKQRKIQVIMNQLYITSKQYYNYKGAIRRLEQLSFMEEDIQFYKTFIFKQKIHSTIKKYNDDLFLININLKLPTDIIIYISDFFTYETQCDLLESKYKPLILINKLSILNINKILSVIYSNDILECKNIIDESTKEIIILKYEIFYNCKIYDNVNLKIKRNIYDTKLFFKNIVLSFRPNCFQILNGLYKLIILLYKTEQIVK